MRIICCTLIAFALGLFALSHGAHAACPEICDPNYNTALGYAALTSLSSGSYNTAIGDSALNGNDTGGYNTAAGVLALSANKNGGINVADGYSALQANVSGFYNVASGGFALGTNIDGSYNVATGANALYYNKASNNTATGHQALQGNTNGGNNVALGYQAGSNLTTGSYNIDIGAGVLGKAGEANKIRIGKQGTQNGTFIAGIYNITEPTASGIKPVYINSNGQVGTTPPASSARFKEAIKSMEKASEGILSLKPVTFRYKDDTERTPQFGLIAEEVAKINPDLVIRDENGEIYTVRYDAVNAMLLNEFLKEHRKVEEQATTITQMKKQIEAVTAGLQRVNSKIELEKPATKLTAGR